MRYAGAPEVAAFLSDRPDYGAIADLGLQARSKVRQTATAAEARTHMAKLDAMAEVRIAEERARGMDADYKRQVGAINGDANQKMCDSMIMGAGNFGANALQNSGGGGGGGYGRLPENPMNGIRAAGITGPIYDFQT